jgi:hypothetical protein
MRAVAGAAVVTKAPVAISVATAAVTRNLFAMVMGYSLGCIHPCNAQAMNWMQQRWVIFIFMATLLSWWLFLSDGIGIIRLSAVSVFI